MTDDSEQNGSNSVTPLHAQLKSDGFAIVPEVLAPGEVDVCVAAVEHRPVTRSSGLRNLVREVPEVAWLAKQPRIVDLVTEVLGADHRLVRSILFDKVPGANWAIRWHQDKTIAVRRRREVEGYGPWSIKAGVVSVQPPEHVLDRMVSVRIHLDDCPAEHGALQVIPGSHRYGKLPSPELRARLTDDVTFCEVPAGGAVLMRPLLLHASSPSEMPDHRRVIHLDFGGCSLDGGLEWSDAA